MPLTDNVRGALWMSASMVGFVVNDALMKSLSGEVPLFQAMLMRGLFATTLIGILAWRSGALGFRPEGQDRRRIALRTIGEVGATCLFLTALFNMPLANATAILQVAALAMTLSAALFLGDQVGWRRYLAITVGFVGVLLIVRPGSEGFNVFSLCALGAVCFVTIRDLATRRLSRDVPGILVTLTTSVAITTMGGLVTVFSDWAPMEPGHLFRLIGASMFLIVGYFAGVEAMRAGEIGVVSPFRYTNLIWAILLGIAVFGEVPSSLTLLGATIIVATGLYTLHRERVVARQR